MRYLALPELEQLNALLSNIESDDGSRITGRLEAYSCKAAGSDKKLWKHLQESREHPSSSDDLFGTSPPPPPPLPASEPTEMTTKLLYYLIATMNQVFPDYDFADLSPEVFTPQISLQQVVSHVNTTLFNTGINKSLTSFGEFSNKMWDRIDAAIRLSDSEVFTFSSNDFDFLEDPFWERGCMYLRFVMLGMVILICM